MEVRLGGNFCEEMSFTESPTILKNLRFKIKI